MRSVRIVLLVAAVALPLAACGGDSGADTTTTTAPAPATSAAAAATTTAAPTTTVAETTTTVAADTHPEFGVRWEDVWPDAGMEATYLVTTFQGDELELPARMEYGVEFAGGTFDRLVVGGAEPGTDGMVIYFDRSEPWQITIAGEEVFRENDPNGAESIYVFETPMVFDGLAPIGETQQLEGRLSLTLSDGTVLDQGVVYDVTLRGVESVTVAAGDFDEVLAIDAGVSGELLGGDFRFALEIWLEAENLFVEYTGASGFDTLELLEPWS